MADTVTVWWAADPSGRRSVSLPLGKACLQSLHTAVVQAFPGLDRNAFYLTDSTRDILSDADVASIRPGESLIVAMRGGDATKPQAKVKPAALCWAPCSVLCQSDMAHPAHPCPCCSTAP